MWGSRPISSTIIIFALFPPPPHPRDNSLAGFLHSQTSCGAGNKQHANFCNFRTENAIVVIFGPWNLPPKYSVKIQFQMSKSIQGQSWAEFFLATEGNTLQSIISTLKQEWTWATHPCHPTNKLAEARPLVQPTP